MHICYPIRLHFQPSRTRHYLDTVDRFKEPADLRYNVKACIGETYDDAVAKAKQAVVEEVVLNWMLQQKELEVSDFHLTYSCEEIVGNRVWMGGCITSSQNLAYED